MKRRWILASMALCSSAWAGTIPVYDGDLSAIGSGVNSAAGKLAGRCLDGTMEDGPANKTMSFQMIMTETSDEVLEQERGYGSAAVDFWIVGGKAKTEFLIRNAESKTQSSLLWKFDFRGGSKVFRKRSPSPLGQEAMSDPSLSGKTCGDSFIIGAETGARLWLAVNLIFESEEKYQYYKTKVSASALGGLVKKSKTSIQEVQDIAKGSYLSIQYLQYGGENFDLDLIDVSLPSVCPIERIDRCLDRYEAIQNYALGPNGFRAAVTLGNFNKLKVLSYRTSSYADAGLRALGVGAIASDPGFAAISDALFSKSRQIQGQLSRILALLSHTSRPLAELEDLRDQVTDLERKALKIRTAADTCQTRSLEECRVQYQLVVGL